MYILPQSAVKRSHLVCIVWLLSTFTLCADAQQWQHYPQPPRAQADAPNILLVMTDDVGFGSSSTFGGLIPTPNLDKLASEGIRYTQFHTTAMCSPTRASLLTGRNHHAVNSGAIGNMSLDIEGYTSVIPPSAATIGNVLGANGYQTGWIGKNHNTPLWEDTPAGPFDRWPNGFGFDYFYGFNGSQTDQFKPTLLENRNQVAVPDRPDYILERDLADHAISWLRNQQAVSGDTPFLLYYAPGTAHSPLQAPQQWLDRFKGKFDMGWDAMRAQVCERQRGANLVPDATPCTPRPSAIPAWSSLSADEQAFSRKLMEAYAAMLAFSDHQFGRVVEELKRSGRYDNTLIIFIQGDNGAAAESLRGELSEVAMFNQLNTHRHDLQLAPLIGTDKSKPVNASGWAWAMNAPFQWSKQVASHFGGTRNGLVVSWPKKVAEPGKIERDFQHVIDVAPTIYDAAGVTMPDHVDGVAQLPLDGVSMLGGITAAAHSSGPAEPRTQYFEILGNRALYDNGWVAATTPRRLPWSVHYIRPHYEWELYHVDEDFSQANNLAKTHPEKLKALQSKFIEVTQGQHVQPIDDRFIERFNPYFRPNIMDGRKQFTYFPSTHSLSVMSVPMLESNWTLTADVTVQADDASGPVFARGDRFSGWGIQIDEGYVHLLYRPSHLDKDIQTIISEAPLTAGKHRITAQMTPLSGNQHQLTMAIDDTQIATRLLIDAVAFSRVETHVGRYGDIPLVSRRPDNGKVTTEIVEVTLH